MTVVRKPVDPGQDVQASQHGLYRFVPLVSRRDRPLSADRDRPSVVVTAATRVFVSRGSFLIAVNRTDRPRPRCAWQ